MNELLEQKAKELEEAENYACWYLVKQQTDFATLAYLVSFLKEYQEDPKGTLEAWIDTRISKTNQEKGLAMTGGYRTLRVAAFFGLIRLNGSRVENSRPSDAYFEVEKRCKGEFEKTKTYQDIIDRQIEKMFISTSIDREYEGVRRDYRLSPVMLLYKVLLELGKAEGKKEESYRISMIEYRMFLATTKRYEEFLDTILYIRLFRNDVFAKASFEEYKDKFDNRFVMALKQLSTLETGKDYIALKSEKIAEVSKKVFEYENMDVEISDQELLDLLCSKKEVTCTKKGEEKTTQRQVDKPYNRIIYGAPGTGKSYCLRQDSQVFGDCMERVTFHPNYSYAQFVGTYKPVMKNQDEIGYQYVPGPFLRMYVQAWKQRECAHLLLIEEINRASVASVFGEMFQLLDRENGRSIYFVHTSEDVREYLAQEFFGKPYSLCLEEEREQCEKMELPDNLYIWATMNSADQGVQPMDTAFKRRWEFEYIGIDQGEEYASFEIPLRAGEHHYLVSWNALRKEINRKLSDECRINEDKLLGPFFLSREVLEKAGEEPERFLATFKGKVLMYLFEDAAKMQPGLLFSGCERLGEKLKLSDIFARFDEQGERIFGFELEHKEPEIEIP